jgi:uncharacterized protein (TIGR02271 family)
MSDPERDERALTRHEEELRVGTRPVDAGVVRAHKTVTSERVTTPVTRQIEDFDHLDRAPAGEGDSGQIEILEDGSISVPILEEELVITKRLIVRERVILRKHVTLAHETVEADLRREHVAVETDPPAAAQTRSTSG